MTDATPRAAAHRLLREALAGTLSTLMPADGAPYGSLVAVATAADGAPLLLLSRLAVHTRNLSADPRACLLLAQPGVGNPLQAPRVSLSGTLAPTAEPADRSRYLARHPDAEGYAGFADFAFYRLRLASAHLVAGFGRIADLTAAELLTDLAGAETVVAAEQDILCHLNQDHAATLQRYATQLCGEPEGGAWRAIGCDPEGLDIRSADTVRRINFLQRTTTLQALRHELKALADMARGNAAQ